MQMGNSVCKCSKFHETKNENKRAKLRSEGSKFDKINSFKKRGGGLGNVRENKSTQANLADAVGLTKVDFSLFTS